MEFVQWVKECSFPTIRNLQLVGTVTNIPKCLLGPTLTKLILRANHGGGSQSIEFIMLVHSLSQMSHLEVLELKDVQLLGNCTQAIMNTPIISLPNLRQLLLWTSHPSAELDYSNLFSLLKISFTVKCTLTFASSTTTQNVTSIFRTLQRYLRSGDLCGLSLRNDFTSSHFGCSLAPLDVRTSFDNFMDQRLIVNLSYALSEPTWGHILGGLDLKGIQTLALKSDCFNGVDLVWRRTLLQCPSLERLSMWGDCANVLIKSLYGLQRLVDSTILLPELVELTLSHVWWRNTDEMIHGEKGRFMKDMVSLLTHRAAMDNPLQNVIIRECCNMDGSDVKELASMGVCVDWDGYQLMNTGLLEMLAVPVEGGDEGEYQYIPMPSSIVADKSF